MEFLPEESGGNWEYLTKIKNMAKESGFLYYAKVSWIKGNQINNQRCNSQQKRVKSARTCND